MTELWMLLTMRRRLSLLCESPRRLPDFGDFRSAVTDVIERFRLLLFLLLPLVTDLLSPLFWVLLEGDGFWFSSLIASSRV